MYSEYVRIRYWHITINKRDWCLASSAHRILLVHCVLFRSLTCHIPNWRSVGVPAPLTVIPTDPIIFVSFAILLQFDKPNPFLYKRISFNHKSDSFPSSSQSHAPRTLSDSAYPMSKTAAYPIEIQSPVYRRQSFKHSVSFNQAIRLHILCESSPSLMEMIHMQIEALFSHEKMREFI